ncbi:MAG: AAA family ATPase [Gammaproteobacteria bacterium]
MTVPPGLAPDQLYRESKFEGLHFETTDDTESLTSIAGQERAREAVTFAVGLRRQGYNLFVLGPAGVGKMSLVREVLDSRAASEPAPSDWSYVNNFKQPQCPKILKLPAGCGSRLRADMEHFVDELRVAIPATFEADEYRQRLEQINDEFGEREGKLFQEVNEEAVKHNIAVLHTPTGFSFAPMRNGEVLDSEEYAKLSDEERKALEATVGVLQDLLQKAIQRGHQLRKEHRDRVRELNREMTLLAVGSLTDELKSRYTELKIVQEYLTEVQADVLENVDEFRSPAEQETNILGVRAAEPDSFRRYHVNVIVGNDDHAVGAPILCEDYPTHSNLLGRIEHIARLGALITDFTLIKAGALHRANGGYLLIDAHKLLTQPFSWQGLKRALASGEIRLDSPAEAYSLISTVGLEPEPVPLDVKVVLFGDRFLYYMMLAYDPQFGELFKVAADFEDEFVRGSEQEAQYARLVSTLVHREKLLPFARAAVARVVEQAARWADDSERLSAQLEQMGDLLREADYCARKRGLSVVDSESVSQAVDNQRRRGSRIREKLQQAILRNELLIDTAGGKVGCVNALSVAAIGEQLFAHPTRITATTRLGDGEVIDIQREIEMGGPIHSKGVLILASYLTSRYAANHPLSLGASLVFEQTYGEVEGDSASVAELAALISSVSNVPLKQSLAITGSVNQHGDVQPIGAVNEKIEGFFELCAARGLSGEQGVIIPKSNIKHLMLRAEVVDAVRDGKFHVYAVSVLDEALELLTGVPSGQRDENGHYPEGSLNDLVTTRLLELSLIRQAYGSTSRELYKKGQKVKKTRPNAPNGKQS